MSEVPSFLKKSVLKVNDVEVSIHQLSGLDRFEFTEFTSNIEYPPELNKPSDDAPIEDKEAFLKQASKLVAQWNKVNFVNQARLVAYGMKTPDEDIDEKHQWVMASFAPEDVEMIHIEVAKLSGMIAKQKEENEKIETPKEKVDPKS
jgi:hypothetical protein